MESGSVVQPSVFGAVPYEGVHVEEALVATEGEASGISSARGWCTLEEEPQMVESLVCEGDQHTLWSLRGNASEDERPQDLLPVLTTLQRGDVQRLKQGLRKSEECNNLLLDAANMETRYVLLEIYAGAANLTSVANEEKSGKWMALQPVDVIYGHNLLEKKVQDQVMEIIDTEKPDLVTLSMPCGPWYSWMNLADPDAVVDKCTADLPLRRFARKVWDKQHGAGRLVMTE